MGMMSSFMAIFGKLNFVTDYELAIKGNSLFDSFHTLSADIRCDNGLGVSGMGADVR